MTSSESNLFIYKTYIFIILIFFTFVIIFIPKLTYAADCTDVSGTTVTISSNCSNLNVAGSNSDITINSGITIDGNSNGDKAIDNSGTSTIIRNNGTLSTDDDFGIFNNDATITTLTNSGTINATDDFAIKNQGASTITTLTNSGTISANDSSGIWNGATITTLTNSGTIEVDDDFGIKNVNGTIGTLTNTGTISAGDRYGLFNDQSVGKTATITTLTNSWDHFWSSFWFME